MGGHSRIALSSGLQDLYDWLRHDSGNTALRRFVDQQAEGGYIQTPEAVMTVGKGRDVTLSAHAYEMGPDVQVELWSTRADGKTWVPDPATRSRDRTYSITLKAERSFEYTFRFSFDGGKTWKWADLTATGGNGRVKVTDQSARPDKLQAHPRNLGAAA
jgi:hypothetical protein